MTVKFSEHTEQYINMAVQERILRWQVTVSDPVVKAKSSGMSVDDLLHTTKLDKIIEERRRSFKYKATFYLHSAIWSHCWENVPKRRESESEERFWSIRQALRGEAGTLKYRDQVLREVAKRYRVVDHAFTATVRRKNGSISRIL